MSRPMTSTAEGVGKMTRNHCGSNVIIDGQRMAMSPTKLNTKIHTNRMDSPLNH